MVTLALDIVDAPASKANQATSVEARFYHSESGEDGRAKLIGDKGDVFGLHKIKGAQSSIIIPSISIGALNYELARGPENAFAEDGSMTPGFSSPPPEDWVVGYYKAMPLAFAYDILAAVMHEILHAMGAEHSKDKDTPNLMGQVWEMGKAGAFLITPQTACGIASTNGVCIGFEQIMCCIEHGAPTNQHGKPPGVHAAVKGLVAPPGMTLGNGERNANYGALHGMRREAWRTR